MVLRMSRSLIPFLFVISGCSQQMSSFYETSKIAVFGQDDLKVSSDYVKNLPYASIYLKIGNAPRGFVVLGEVNQQNLKWYSADHAMVMTHVGRVVKTVGLPHDLNYSSNSDTDPLINSRSMLNMKTPVYWDHQEFSANPPFRSGLRYQSTFTNNGVDTVKILDQSRQVIQIEENVTVAALSKTYRNIFWLDPMTGAVVQSEQYLYPADTLVQLTVLKPYAG